MFLGDVGECSRTLQRLRVDVAVFVGGGICSTEKKSQIPGFMRRGRMVRAWSTIFVGFEDDGSRELGRFSVK